MSFALASQSKKNEVNDKTSTPVKSSAHNRGVNNLALTTQDSIIHLQQTIGNQAVQRLMRSKARNGAIKNGIQTKLKVSQPGDAYEQEADRVADEVMRMSTPSRIGISATGEEDRISRKCSACEMKKKDEEERKLKISRKPMTMSNFEPSNEVTNDIRNVPPSGGSSLDNNTQEFMESKFGYDFSRVRIHTDTNAAESARTMNALAYTLGEDIVFGDGQYSPNTVNGRCLLAHELTHTIQQGSTKDPFLMQRQETLTAEQTSIVDPRIDVRAQFALLRLFKGESNDAKDARDLFTDVKTGKIKGIFGDDLAIAAKLAAERDTVRWKLVPAGQDAVMLEDESSETPVIIFKEAAGRKPRLDQALLVVFREHRGSSMPTESEELPELQKEEVIVPGESTKAKKGRPKVVAQRNEPKKPVKIIPRDPKRPNDFRNFQCETKRVLKIEIFTGTTNPTLVDLILSARLILLKHNMDLEVTIKGIESPAFPIGFDLNIPGRGDGAAKSFIDICEIIQKTLAKSSHDSGSLTVFFIPVRTSVMKGSERFSYWIFRAIYE